MPPIPNERPCCPSVRGTRPLPDPAAVRLCLIPESAPPYDSEITRGASASGAGLAGPLFSSGGETTDRPPSTEPSQGAEPGQGAEPRRAAPGRRQAPEPKWPSRFAQVLAETLAGSRPAIQLVPWTTERARDHIQRLGPRLTSSQQPRVRRVVTSCPAADVMEMSVVVGFGARIRALAVRLERSGPPSGRSSPAGEARWLCTAVEAA